MKIEHPILYKRSNLQDKINQWQIVVENDSYYTISGYVGMKQFQNEPTQCIAKNVGKKNETTPVEQAVFEAQQMWQKRKDLGYHEDIKDVDNKVYFEPMLATEYSKIKNIPQQVLSQPKLDGMRCILKSDGMWTRTGKEIISAPHIYESVKHIFEKYPDLILDGELYTSNEDVDFNTIISCVRKTKPTKEDLKISAYYINYWVYDLPNLDNKDYCCADRLFGLSDLISKINSKLLVEVPTYELHSKKQIESKLLDYIAQGFEGQILRLPNSFYENKRSKSLIKHKIFFDEEFKIIGYAEGIGKFSGKLATIKVDVDGVSVDCTINGTMEYLEELFQIKETLIGKMATIKYFEKTVDNSLRFPKCINIDRID